MSPRRGYGLLVRVWGRNEAEVVKSRLAAEGVPAILKGEALGDLYGITVDGLGAIEIWVPVFRLDEARTILGL